MTNDQIEQEIQAKGLTAPRVTLADIEAKVASETYTMLPSGKVMICELVLQNGFSVRGESCVVSPENFDRELGEKYSRSQAIDAVWMLEGYLLQERLYQAKQPPVAPA